MCLSSVVHYEASGERLEGKIAVASVILNRMESSKFPDALCDVVKQRGQFSWYGKRPLTNKQITFATQFLNGKYKRTVPTSLFFTALSVKLNRRVTHVIGGHRFYA